LGRLGAREAAGSCAALLRHGRPSVRAAAAEGLGRMGGAQAESALRAAGASEKDPRAKRAIRRALERIAEERQGAGMR